MTRAVFAKQGFAAASPTERAALVSAWFAEGLNTDGEALTNPSHGFAAGSTQFTPITSIPTDGGVTVLGWLWIPGAATGERFEQRTCRVSTDGELVACMKIDGFDVN